LKFSLLFKPLVTLLLFCTSVAIAQTFPQLKAQIQSEQKNQKKLALLNEVKNKLAQYQPAQQVEYWFLTGRVLAKQHHMNEAITAFTKAIESFSLFELTPSNILVDLYIERSIATTSLDFFNSYACEDRERALTLSRELAQLSLIAKSIAYYAKCLQTEQHGITKSLKLFDEAFDIATNQQLDLLTKQIIFNQAATLSFRALMYDKAYEYNNVAQELYTSTNDISSIYVSILNAIHYSIALVDISLAKQHLAELERFYQHYPEFIDALLKFYYLSAKVAQLDENWPLSVYFLERGIEEISHGQNVSYIQATYELLSISYFRVGDIDKSYETLSTVEAMYPNKKAIKQEVLLIKASRANNPIDIVRSAFELSDKQQQSKNTFVKQSTAQSAQLFDDNLQQLDNIILQQRLTIVLVSTFFLVSLLVGFSYLQIQRKKLAVKEHQLTGSLLNKKNQLLADVSHELSTPLTVLKLQVESLKDDLEDDVQATYDALDNKLDDIQHLIDDIHQLAQSDIGALKLNLQPFSLHETLLFWEQELTQFVNKNKLTFDINIAIPKQLIVNFDRDRLKQIFTNLLTNSIKYTDKPGKVKLSAAATNNTLLLTIEDSAPGVSNEDLVTIFERLYRVESSRSRATGGSGLGLSICKSLIEEHKGKIYAQHSPLGGLKIVIELPF